MLSDWAGRLPALLLRASSTALLSLAVSDVSTAEGAAAAATGPASQPHAAVLHTAGQGPFRDSSKTYLEMKTLMDFLRVSANCCASTNVECGHLARQTVGCIVWLLAL